MPRQKNTKLSLKKSTSSDNKRKDVKPVLPAGGCFDLNETCDFQQPAVFRSGQGDAKIKSESEDVDAVESANSSDDVLCQVCSKNLAHMNVQRRQQHVNRCIDKVEVSERLKNEEQKMLESAKTAVLDCPMCGKHFKTENSRLSHLKKCSQDLGVSTEKMLQLVKEQEEERNVHIAAGIIPQHLKAQVSKGKVVKKKRQLKEPKNQYEEDVQVAMAMSSSLATESDHTSGQSDKERGKKGKKNKNVMEDVCLLTTLTDADRQRKIQEKVSNILHTVNSSYKMYTPGSLCESSIKLENQQPGISLWGRSSQDPNLCDIDMFYVGALVPPLIVSTVKPGANLRRMSSIPGRESSFISEKHKYTDKVSSGMSSLGNVSQDEVITASTQTVAVLAELAVDDTDLSQTRAGSQIIPTQRSNLNTSLLDLQASGFCVQTLSLQSEDQALINAETLSDYKKMINNREYSDVSIESLNGDTFCAHKLILAARCPKLLQMLKDFVIRLDAPSDIVLSLLEFVYCGNLTVMSSVQSELEKLAEQLEFTSLSEACKKLERPEDAGDLQTDNMDNEDEFVESQIDLKEIWGESDSDSDEQDNGELRDSKSADENTDRISEDNDSSSEEEVEIPRADCDHSRQCDVLVKNNSDTNDDATGNNNEILKDNNISTDEETEPATGDKSKSLNFRHAGNINRFDGANEEFGVSSKGEAEIEDIGNNCDKGNGDGERRGTVVKKVGAFQLGSSQSDVSRNSYPESIDHSDDNVNSDGEVISDNNDSLEGGYTDTEVVCCNENIKRISFKRGIDESNNATAKMLTENHGSLPHAKRLRYSAERKETVDSFVVDSNNSCDNYDAPDQRIRNDGDKNRTFEITDKGIENSSKEMDTSTVDLFGTPSPKKSSVTVLEGVSFLKERLKVVSKFSTPLESRSGPNKSLISGNSPISPLIQSKQASSKKLLGKDIKSINDDDGGLLHKGAETFVVSEETETSSVENDRFNSTAASDDEMVSSDDDIEITGDNFHEISQQSPTFSHSRNQSRSSNCSTNYVLSSSKINKTTYLGIPSTAGDLCSNKTFNIEGENSSSENEKLVRNRTFTDSGSESEEIVTIETDGSEGCDECPSENSESDEIVTIEIEGCDIGDKCPSENSDYNLYNVGNSKDAENCSNSYTKSLNSTFGCSENDTAGAGVNVFDVDDDGETLDSGSNTAVEDAGCTDNSMLQNQSFGYDANGVWEDFEDCGAEFEPAVKSPVEISPAKCETNSNAGNIDRRSEQPDGETEDNLLEDGEDSFVFKVDDDRDISVDPKLTKHTVPQKSKFKTPTSTLSREQRKRPWVPPSPFTPMPSYSVMPTPVLKKEIQKYGVKPVGKKRMVKMLEDIYHQTHQYETDSDYEEDSGEPATSSGTGAACMVDEATREQDDDCASNQDDVCSSQGDFSSQDSDISEVLEESCLHMVSSDSDTTSSPQKNVDVAKKMLEYMKSNSEIHFKVLTYEPLELDVLKKDMKEAGIKCSMDKLMDFLDERCIAFTTKNSRKRPSWRRGRQKKTKAKGSDNKTSNIKNSTDG